MSRLVERDVPECRPRLRQVTIQCRRSSRQAVGITDLHDRNFGKEQLLEQAPLRSALIRVVGSVVVVQDLLLRIWVPLAPAGTHQERVGGRLGNKRTESEVRFPSTRVAAKIG